MFDKKKQRKKEKDKTLDISMNSRSAVKNEFTAYTEYREEQLAFQ